MEAWMSTFFGPAAFLAGFLLYVRCASGAFFPDDSPWTITAIFNLESQHPPGYPLFTLFGKLWCLLPIGGIATRTSVMAAFLMAAVGAFLALFVRRLLMSELRQSASQSNVLSVLACAFFCLGWTAWAQALSCKGAVYSFSLLFTLALAWLVLGIGCSASSERRELPLSGLLLGLGLAHHWMSIVVIIPVLALPYLWWRREQLMRSTSRGWSLALLFVVVGLSVYLALPIRAGRGVVNWGYGNSVGRLTDVVTRAQYRSTEVGPVPAGSVVRKATYAFHLFTREWTVLGLIAVIGGLAVAFSVARRIALVIVLVALLNAFSVLIFWQKPEDHFFNLDPFLLPSFAFCSIFFGLGLGWVAARIRSSPVRGAALGVIGALVLSLGIGRTPSNDYSRMYVSSDYARNLLVSVPHRTVLLCNGDLDWFPVLFERFVELRRPDVTPICFTMICEGEYSQLRMAYLGAPEVFLRVNGGTVMNQHGARRIIGTMEVESFDTERGPDIKSESPATIAQQGRGLDMRLRPMGLTRRLPDPAETPSTSIRLLKRMRYRGLWWAQRYAENRAMDLIQTPSIAWVSVAAWLGAGRGGRPSPELLEVYRWAIRLPMCPSEPQCRYGYAHWLYRTGRFEECRSIIAPAVAMDPTFEQAKKLLALVEWRLSPKGSAR
jgi:hypothetical protein